jgi:FtsP/CotA-like multicopper oxidase with cupredoxin domain
MRNNARSKKMVHRQTGRKPPTSGWTDDCEHGPHQHMPDRNWPLSLTRRSLLAGLGAAVALPCSFRPGLAQQAQALQLREQPLRLREGSPETIAWRFDQGIGVPDYRFRVGDTLSLDLTNDLPVPVNLNWYGLDGIAGAEPLLAERALGPGQRTTRSIPLRFAGTYFVETRIGSEGAAKPLPGAAFAVGEASPPQIDRDDILLIEDWRLKPDGSLLAPGQDSTNATTIYTINGKLDWNILARANQRLRLRFINGCHRSAIALRIDGHAPRVIAIDGRPAEPFPARDGRLILTPGTRIDVLVDATKAPKSVSPIHLHDGTTPRLIANLTYSDEPPVRETLPPPTAPLANDGLPTTIPLQGAQRIELALGGANGASDWVTAERISTQLAPIFRAKASRTVVLAITNRAPTPVTFHLHGHHFRLLDRLDDGWKPFWLDTLLFDAGQTQRIAFLAENRGAWLMEAMGIEWTAPRLLRWFAVE